MLVQADTGRKPSAHVVVIGNEKGGSGKSTIAFHVAVALMKAGQRVASIDLDSRQKSLTRYVENRRDWGKRKELALELPNHHCVARSEGLRADDNENAEFNDFIGIVSQVERDHDFIVIDTPGINSYLMRLAHNMADTLITPLNDSFVDLDVLGAVDPVTFTLTGRSHYSELVRAGAARPPQRRFPRYRLDCGAQPRRHRAFAQQAAAGAKSRPARSAACLPLDRRFGGKARPIANSIRAGSLRSTTSTQ